MIGSSYAGISDPKIDVRGGQSTVNQTLYSQLFALDASTGIHQAEQIKASSAPALDNQMISKEAPVAVTSTNLVFEVNVQRNSELLDPAVVSGKSAAVSQTSENVV